MTAIITLCTDFGTRDGYVAAMKGVMLSIAPETRLVDISHDVAPQNVQAAAFVLSSCARYFPQGTVHLVVVDPGVGSERQAVAVRSERHLYVAPDNGVLSLALRYDPPQEVVRLDRPRHWRTAQPSRTFHGRDIFSPAAAHLARGVPLAELGAPVEGTLVELPLPAPTVETGGVLVGHVLHIDHFGNVISDIPAEQLGLQSARPEQIAVGVGDMRLPRLWETYTDVGRGELLALVGSHGYLEIAVREGDAAQHVGARVGDVVRVCRRSQAS